MEEEAATGTHQVRVYRYAVHGDLPADAIAELRRAHNLRNQLVEIELRYAERLKEAWAKHPEVARLTEAIDAATLRVEKVVEDGKRIRKQDRTTDVGKKQRALIKAAKAELRALKRELRDTKERLYALDPAVKPRLIEANTKRKAELKATYRPTIDGGLYWATYNDVRAHHDTAVRAVGAKRSQGQAAQLRFHGWRGEGTLAIQLQRGASDPLRTPQAIGDLTGRWRNVITVEPVHDPTHWATLTRSEQRRAARGRVRFRIGSGDATSLIELPLIVHRPIPPDADITLVRITRRRLGARYRVGVSITVKLPAVPQRIGGAVGAAHIGWRVLSDDSLRVATLVGAPTVLPRSDIADIVRLHDGWAEIVIPLAWRQLQGRYESLRSRRDTNLDLLRNELVEWVRLHPDNEETKGIHLWRSPRRFKRLLDHWTENPPPDPGNLLETLQAWNRQDYHLWMWEANERDKLRARRKDKFRKVAAWLCDAVAVVAIDSWEISARRPTIEETDDPQARAARANRVLAASAELRQVIELAAASRGVRVAAVTPEATVHRTCGTAFDAAERRDQIMVWCPTCQVAVDQDVNAAQELAARALR